MLIEAIILEALKGGRTQVANMPRDTLQVTTYWELNTLLRLGMIHALWRGFGDAECRLLANDVIPLTYKKLMLLSVFINSVFV